MTHTRSQSSVAQGLIITIPTAAVPAGTAESEAPLIIGVSGHRDLDPRDTPRLRAAVGEFLQQIRACLPDTEVRVIVGMASGADLLVAEAALDLGLSIDAVLPLSRYAADFEAETFRELEALLVRPNVRCTELSLPAEADSGAGSGVDAHRDAHYLNLTRTLVRSCHLLLAVWDGRPSGAPGGTTDTVLRYLGLRLEGVPHDGPIEFNDASVGQDPDSRIVYWIPVVRRGGSAGDHPAMPCYSSALGDDVLLRWPSMPQPLRDQLMELNAYNREYRRLAFRRWA
jgi:hypothetical protein